MRCKNCNKIIDKNELSKYASGRFCSKHCAAKHSRNFVDDNDLKKTSCSLCGKELGIKKRASSKKVKCDECRKRKNFSYIKKSYPIEEILSGKHPNYSTYKLKERLIKEGYKKHKCEMCGLTEGNDEKCPIVLDHIDGNCGNHSYENLQILCPNCNAQTKYNAGKNKRKRSCEISDNEFFKALKNNKNIRQALIYLNMNSNGRANYLRAYKILKEIDMI